MFKTLTTILLDIRLFTFNYIYVAVLLTCIKYCTIFMYEGKY